MNLDEVLQTFLAEARDLLQEMEATLLRVGAEDDPAESIHAIFRAAHTIKGSAGLFGLDATVAFTHAVETLLDDVRKGRVELDRPLILLLLACADHIGSLIGATEAGQRPLEPAEAATGEALLARLQGHLAAPRAATAAPPTCPSASSGPAAGGTGAPAPAAIGAEHWHISLRPGPGVLKLGMDPLSLIGHLQTLGSIEHIVTLDDAVPTLAELDPECCCLGFEIAFKTSADKATIESAFEFVIDDCALHIVPPHSRACEFLALIEQLPEEPKRLGEILVLCGSITAHELEAALQLQRGQQALAAEPSQRIGAILTDQGKVSPQVVQAALVKQKQGRESRAQESQSVRVDAAKLDQLITLVGELIIASAAANLAARKTQQPELQECNATLAELVEEVRDSALQLRMVKIGATFGRFKRIVHDVALELGKDIALELSGEDTELDKTVVEKIGDPLMHLVRNAMDHGIDARELRAARGKPPQGTVRLNAFHDSGSIVIEVIDDGSGLDRDRILHKAIERGLVDAGRVLSDAEVHALIFEPGFSTAEQVTNLSGRGVGLDVVKRNIAALRGSVTVASSPGRGTTFRVRLPLTLAIIDGFQVAVGQSVFVVPLDMVEECVEFSADCGREYTDLRGRLLPFIRLRELFEVQEPAAARQNIVVVNHAGHKVGLVVDTLLGEAQTVIKPLSKMFAHVRGISGSSILGSGDVALILDVPALLQLALHGAAPMGVPTGPPGLAA